jgi:hypothetical protein
VLEASRRVIARMSTPASLFVGRRDCSRLAVGMCWQVEATEAALGDPEIPVSPVLCFIDADWPLLGGPRRFKGVLIESERLSC